MKFPLAIISDERFSEFSENCFCFLSSANFYLEGWLGKSVKMFDWGKFAILSSWKVFGFDEKNSNKKKLTV